VSEERWSAAGTAFYSTKSPPSMQCDPLSNIPSSFMAEEGTVDATSEKDLVKLITLRYPSSTCCLLLLFICIVHRTAYAACTLFFNFFYRVMSILSKRSLMKLSTVIPEALHCHQQLWLMQIGPWPISKSEG